MKAPRNAPRTEGELQKWFVKELKAEGYLPYKFASPAMRGVPDLVIVNPYGGVFFVEMKHPNGRGILSPLQRVKIRGLLDNNATVFIAESIEDCFAIYNGTKPKVRYAEL